ncbi:MFS transporter [Rathayibacter toxicus]|uniref:Major facilitator transporter n=1 Tax=Rathayibacter toxicus TaxID=145458 RepID=A0A0C5BDQ6_9MICO|nr:MFS transporter [Rathayibacter toxicus]AJM77074.1 major facilitator transporter [Rathayibacter toxicus]ALS57109.1 MFS transporter [Rathayibacter toxicus]KKM46077.1 major facilitator transporter [Rathayibacter toxicus]PPG23014.1 MFS transporter [Rathayibacter toxicus]PPG47596.1 MFS transporter [Rathayibacter toxicus]
MTDITTDARPTSDPRAWRALIVLLAGMFIALLDTTIVNVALPTIRTTLGASEATLSWIISGYALAFGLTLIPAGRLGDRFGHKWTFVSGVTLFTVASFLCGLATNDVQLILARVFQGLAGGTFVPAVNASIQLLFRGSARGTAFAIMGAVLGVSSALGPIIGGLIIQAFGDENGWRLVFWVNLPIGLSTLLAALLLLPSRGRIDSGEHPPSGGVDWLGLVFVSSGLVALLVPLIEGEDEGWPLWTAVSIGGGLLLLAAFGAWEVLHARRGRVPLVPPSLFRRPAFTGGVILALVYFAAFTSIFFTISLLWQAGLGHTALESGLVSIPFAIGSIISSSQSNRITARLGRTVLVMGSGLLAVGLLWVWLVLVTSTVNSVSHWQLLTPLLIAGLGNGLFVAPNVQFIVATVDPGEAGAASGVIATIQRIGSAVGIAAIGSVLFGSLVITGPDTVASGFLTAAAHAMLLSAVLALIAFALVFVLPKSVSRHG